MFFKKKKNRIEQLIYDYFELSEKCLNVCENVFLNFCNDKYQDEELFEQIKNAHMYESKGDDLRRDIEYMMYNNSLIPESRGDILGLLENIDRIPNQGEACIRELYQSNIQISKDYKTDFEALYSINHEAAKKTLEMARIYFKNPNEVNILHKEIELLESNSDRKEITLIRKIMTSKSDLFEKLTLKPLIKQVGQISDISEDVSDRIKLLSVKMVF